MALAQHHTHAGLMARGTYLLCFKILPGSESPITAASIYIEGGRGKGRTWDEYIVDVKFLLHGIFAWKTEKYDCKDNTNA